MKSSSRYSLVHILPASLSNSAPVPSHVALATVCCTFCRPPLPKVLRTSPFLTTFMCKPGFAAVLYTLCRPHLPKVEIELSLQSRALFVDNLQPRKKRPWKHFNRKHTMFRTQECSTREFMRSRAVTLSNSWMIGG